MRAEDLVVEVRDKALTRLGQILPADLDGKFTIADSAMGEWKLRLRADHPMATHLRTPGAGIIVTGPDGVLMSGPMVKSDLEVTFEDQTGVVTVEGVTDEVILWDSLAWPTPDFDFTLGSLMPDGWDIQIGLPLDLMLHFLDVNLGRLEIGMLGYGIGFDASALDPPPSWGPNLITNSAPALPAVWSDNSGYTWYIWGEMGDSMGPIGITTTCYETTMITLFSDVDVWPVLGGTEAIPVTEGTSYQVSAQVGAWPTGGSPYEVRTGVRWFDVDGVFISESMDATAVITVEGGGVPWMENGTPYTNLWTASPVGVHVAPTGAVYGRPAIRFTGTDPDFTGQLYVADFHFQAAV